MSTTKTLRALLWLMGVSLVAIGFYHLIGGITSVPGTASVEGTARATVDSRERFYNPVFAGYGVLWIYAARQPAIPTTLVNWLTGVFLLGGIGRLLSLAIEGRPHWFQIPLSAIELVLPLVLFALVAVEQKDQLRRDRSAAPAG